MEASGRSSGSIIVSLGKTKDGMRVDVVEGVREVLRDALELGDRADGFDVSTPLFGSLAEFDSMAVVTVVLALEDCFDIVVDGDEISAETFETFGNLTRFVEGVLSA